MLSSKICELFGLKYLQLFLMRCQSDLSGLRLIIKIVIPLMFGLKYYIKRIKIQAYKHHYILFVEIISFEHLHVIDKASDWWYHNIGFRWVFPSAERWCLSSARFPLSFAEFDRGSPPHSSDIALPHPSFSAVLRFPFGGYSLPFGGWAVRRWAFKYGSVFRWFSLRFSAVCYWVLCWGIVQGEL